MRRRIVFLALCVWGGAALAQQQPLPGFTSQAAELQPVRQVFGAWLSECEAQPNASGRHCSFYTAAKDASGKTIATMAVSDKQGVPIAVLSVDPGIALNQPIVIEFVAAPKPAPDKPAAAAAMLKFTRPVPSSCDPQHCTLLWQITGADIRALRSGRDLVLSFKVVPADKIGPWILAPAPRLPIQAIITTTGFEEALQAALK